MRVIGRCFDDSRAGEGGKVMWWEFATAQEVSKELIGYDSRCFPRDFSEEPEDTFCMAEQIWAIWEDLSDNPWSEL